MTFPNLSALAARAGSYEAAHEELERAACAIASRAIEAHAKGIALPRPLLSAILRWHRATRAKERAFSAYLSDRERHEPVSTPLSLGGRG